MLIQYDRVDADEARESRYRLVPVDDPRALCAALESSLGHAGGGREGAPPAAVAERPHPPRPRQGPRQLRRARGRRDRGLRPRRRARARHAPDRGARDRPRADPAQLLLRPGRRLDRAGRGRARGDGARARALQPLPRRRRAAGRGRLDPRRRQRRERRLPAGPVRGGLRDRRADRLRAQADHRGRGDLRRRRTTACRAAAAASGCASSSCPARRSTCARAPARARRRRSRRCCRAPSARSSCRGDARPASPRGWGSCSAPASAGSPTRSTDPTHFPYADLDGFPQPSVAGHGGHAVLRRAQRPAGRVLRRAASTSTRAATRARCGSRSAR